jgi:Tfp pilus assembly protein PilE
VTYRSRAAARRAPGFSLIEIMNFVALATLISALAMYALARYVRHSKTAEAVAQLTALIEASAIYYEKSDSTQPAGTTPDAAHAMRHFPPSSNGTVPGDLAAIRGKKYKSVAADWAGPPWADLRFEYRQPQCYAYSYDSQGTGTTARAVAYAQGDLDGDGKTSTYSLGAAADAQFKVQVDKEIQRTDPEE